MTMIAHLTKSGAVVHIDSDSEQQNALLSIALDVFGGSVAQVEIPEEA